MDISPQQETNPVASVIAAVRQAWLEAVSASDAGRLGALVTDDVVVVHGNGRCVCGREERKFDFLKGFEASAPLAILRPPHRHAAGQLVTLAGGKGELGQYALLPPVGATDLW
jgi:ketosteroid isomerase-like protein